MTTVICEYCFAEVKHDEMLRHLDIDCDFGTEFDLVITPTQDVFRKMAQRIWWLEEFVRESR